MRIPLGVEPKFGRLVRELERWASARPRRYRLIVLQLALCGYLYLLSLLVVVLAAAGWLALQLPVLFVVPSIGVYVLGPFLVLAGIIVRALWVRVQPPRGYVVTRTTAPALFALLERVRHAANGPRLHHVLIIDELNASVAQIPRLGIFGWNRTYLMLGLPLMQAVSEDELTAIIAHEYGHLTGRHGWFRGWIYRLRITWWRIALALQQRARWSRWLFAPFYALYVPYFNAYSFVLARTDEYEADRMSVEVAGAAAAARALLRVNTLGHYLSARFWPALYKTANIHEEPPYLPMARLSEEFGKPLADPDVIEGYNLALARSTDLSDTHPATSDRLRAIGATPAPVEPPRNSAALRLLGPELLSKIVDRLDTEWRWSTLEGWRNHYKDSREDRQRLTELDEKVRTGDPTAKERVNRARLTERFIGEDQALPLFREIVAADLNNAQAHFDLGRVLVGRNDAEGLNLLEAAMRIDDRLTMAAWFVISPYMMRAGRMAEAETYRLRLLDQQQLEERAAEERTPPRWRDRFDAHGLGEEELSRFVQNLQPYHALRRAYLVRKRVTLLPHRPFYILLVKATTSLHNLDYSLTQLLANAVEFPGDAYIIHLTWKQYWLLWRFRRLSSALILSKF